MQIVSPLFVSNFVLSLVFAQPSENAIFESRCTFGHKNSILAKHSIRTTECPLKDDSDQSECLQRAFYCILKIFSLAYKTSTNCSNPILWEPLIKI